VTLNELIAEAQELIATDPTVGEWTTTVLFNSHSEDEVVGRFDCIERVTGVPYGPRVRFNVTEWWET
jgi:hypothetical protein